MTKDEGSSNVQMMKPADRFVSSFGFRHSFVIMTFVIRHFDYTVPLPSPAPN